MEEILGLGHNVIELLPDMGIHPRSKADVQKIVAHCNRNSIPVHVYDGGSPVSQGLECGKGGIPLVMAPHMNKDLNEFRRFQQGFIEQINANKGSLIHHHGVGRLMAPFMENHLGKERMDVLKALKRHFDTNAIMNPGGTQGLD